MKTKSVSTTRALKLVKDWRCGKDVDDIVNLSDYQMICMLNWKEIRLLNNPLYCLLTRCMVPNVHRYVYPPPQDDVKFEKELPSLTGVQNVTIDEDGSFARFDVSCNTGVDHALELLDDCDNYLVAWRPRWSHLSNPELYEWLGEINKINKLRVDGDLHLVTNHQLTLIHKHNLTNIHDKHVRFLTIETDVAEITERDLYIFQDLVHQMPSLAIELGTRCGERKHHLEYLLQSPKVPHANYVAALVLYGHIWTLKKSKYLSNSHVSRLGVKNSSRLCDENYQIFLSLPNISQDDMKRYVQQWRKETRARVFVVGEEKFCWKCINEDIDKYHQWEKRLIKYLAQRYGKN